MASAKDLFNKLGNSSGGFSKPAKPPAIAPVDSDEKKPGKPAGKHFDADQKGHNMKGKGPGGASIPTAVRPKV